MKKDIASGYEYSKNLEKLLDDYSQQQESLCGYERLELLPFARQFLDEITPILSSRFHDKILIYRMLNGGGFELFMLWLSSKNSGFDTILSHKRGGFRFDFAKIESQLFARRLPPFMLANPMGRYFQHNIERNVRHLLDGGSARDLPVFNGNRLSPMAAHLLMNATPADLSLWEAIRWARAMAIFPHEPLANEISRRAFDEAGEESYSFTSFLDEVVLFFKNHISEIVDAQIGPLLDFIVQKRVNSPDFRLKGRTMASVSRLMEAWHAELAKNREFEWAALSWEPSTLGNFVVPGYKGRFEFVELNTRQQLFEEGSDLNHCVASYAEQCAVGESSIWSLRKKVKTGDFERLLTIELAQKAIVQVRGRHNRLRNGFEDGLLRDWAGEMGLHYSSRVDYQ